MKQKVELLLSLDTKNMKNQLKLSLLKTIKNNGNLMNISSQGYGFNQILDFLKLLVVEGYVSRSGNNVAITNKGRIEIENLNHKLNRKNIEKWIEPEFGSRIPSISKNDVFLPNQKELFFE